MRIISEARLENKRVLMRVDFNVPLDKTTFEVTDDKRIREAIPTIQYVLDNGGSVIIMSHLGRPKTGPEDKYSLRHTISAIQKYLKNEILFGGDCIGEEAFRLSAGLKPGQVLLLENVRFYPEEEKGNREFAEKLSGHGDLYVNDAFGTAHRAHASTAVIAEFFPEQKYAGFLLAREIEMAEKVVKHSVHPVTAIMGGAKVSDKILIIERLLDKIDFLLIGGGMAYTFLRARGYKVGTSLVENDKIAVAAQLIKDARAKNVTILLPVDSVVADKFAEDAKTAIAKSDDMPDDMMGLDIGPLTFESFFDTIMDSKTILWNGPMGVFEMEKFAAGTNAVAQAVVKATEKGAFSLIGGGDSAAAISKAGLESKVSYVSTGGGALLEYLEGKELPGIAALD
ncbi:MAG: phosphoglycerate kinase [Bacteroidia bacterium]|nr:phosphoglycerate kinase [Bacteroidia bacterium]